MSGLPRPRSTSGSPSRAAAAATRASSAVKYCSGRRSSLRGVTRRTAELDGEPEADVFERRAEFCTVGDAPRAEPVADLAHEPLRGGRAGRDADGLHSFEPRLVDLGCVVNEMGRYAL